MFKNQGNSFCSRGPRNKPRPGLITESWGILRKAAAGCQPCYSNKHQAILRRSGAFWGCQTAACTPSTAPAVTAGWRACPELHFPLAESAAVITREITPYIYIISTYKWLQLPGSCFKILQRLPIVLRASRSVWAYFSRFMITDFTLVTQEFFLCFHFLKHSFPGQTFFCSLRGLL